MPTHSFRSEAPLFRGVQATRPRHPAPGRGQVRSLLAEIASLASDGRAALERRDLSALASLMNRNFDLRRRLASCARLRAPFTRSPRPGRPGFTRARLE